MQEVGLIVLGAILALGTSVVLELYRQSVLQKRIRVLLSTLLLDEIETLADLFDSLAEDTPRLGYVLFQHLTEIGVARQGFDRNRDNVVFYPDEHLRRDLFRFYREVGRVGGGAYSLESMRNDHNITTQSWWSAHYQQELAAIPAKAADVASRGRLLIAELKKVKP